jgi:uncharacterized protein DUF4166/saccharopine dehydrogenase-like protein
MTGRLTILIVGGYGTFGGRLVELLEDEARLNLVVAGRSLAKATSYCTARHAATARLVPAAFDRDGDLGAQIAAWRPDIVVDASGPFQAYGDERYRLVQACIAARTNYLDLADGADFVSDVATLDADAAQAGVYVLSGVSSFPVLTAAVVRHLGAGMAKIETIQGGIAPSPFAGVGLNVIRAISGYAGQPARLKRDGRMSVGYPLTEHMRFTVAPPGLLPLRSTWFSLVDVPDLTALAELWPEARTIWMGAGPVPEALHRVLAGLARLVRTGIVPSLSPLAPLMHFVSNRLAWGEHRGGMFVRVTGTTAQGRPIEKSWHLLAEGDDGPLIPSMAIEALVRKALDGSPPRPGARPAVRELELDDYERMFARRSIFAGTREAPSEANLPLYTRVLGSAWSHLPPEIRAMHDLSGSLTVKGRATVERGQGLLARLVAAVVGFPEAASDTDVSVRFEVSEKVERWTRNFGGRAFFSHQFAGKGRSDGLLCERFGPFTFAMALVATNQQLRLVLRRWSLLGVPLPMWLCPRSESYEAVVDGRFRFDVAISHPLTGLIVRYQGWLAP